MIIIHHQPQMYGPSHGGAPCGARSIHALAADDKQGRGHVSPVGHKRSSCVCGLSLTDLLNSGGLRLPHFSSFTHCARVSLRSGAHRRLIGSSRLVSRHPFKLRQHFDRQISNAAENHSRCLFGGGFQRPQHDPRGKPISWKSLPPKETAR